MANEESYCGSDGDCVYDLFCCMETTDWLNFTDASSSFVGINSTSGIAAGNSMKVCCVKEDSKLGSSLLTPAFGTGIICGIALLSLCSIYVWCAWKIGHLWQYPRNVSGFNTNHIGVEDNSYRSFRTLYRTQEQTPELVQARQQKAAQIKPEQQEKNDGNKNHSHFSFDVPDTRNEASDITLEKCKSVNPFVASAFDETTRRETSTQPTEATTCLSTLNQSHEVEKEDDDDDVSQQVPLVDYAERCPVSSSSSQHLLSSRQTEAQVEEEQLQKPNSTRSNSPTGEQSSDKVVPLRKTSRKQRYLNEISNFRRSSKEFEEDFSLPALITSAYD